MNVWRTVGSVLVILAGPIAGSRAAPVRCPPTLTVEQRATGVAPGLHVFDRTRRHVWTSAELSDGPPEEQAWLAPDRTVTQRQSFTNIWVFAPANHGIWLTCVYTDTSVVVAWRLPTATRQCEIRYDSTGSPPGATAIDCE